MRLTEYMEVKEISEKLSNVNEQQINEFLGLGKLFKKLKDWAKGSKKDIKAADKVSEKWNEQLKKDYVDALGEISEEEDVKKRQEIIDKFKEKYKDKLENDDDTKKAVLSLETLNVNLSKSQKNADAEKAAKEALEKDVKKYKDTAEQLSKELEEAKKNIKDDDKGEEGEGDGKDDEKGKEKPVNKIEQTVEQEITDNKSVFSELAKKAGIDGDDMLAWTTAQIQAISKNKEIDGKVRGRLTQKTSKVAKDGEIQDIYLGATVALLGACIINDKGIFDALAQQLIKESPKSSIIKSIGEYKKQVKDIQAQNQKNDKGGEEGK